AFRHSPKNTSGRAGTSLVTAGHRAERDGQAIPAVNGYDRQRKIDQLGFGELFSHALVQLVWDVVLGDERERLGPFERSSFTLGIERRFTPGREPVETLFGFAAGAGVFGVHVDTVRAAVDL